MSKVLNEQLHVALVLAAPVLAIVSAAAPLVLQVLYSSAFVSSDFLLRLLLAAGLLRLPIWALGFVLLARGAGASYLLGEIAAASMIPLAWLLIGPLGLVGAGIAAVIAGLIAFAMYFTRAKLRHEVTINGENLRFVGVLVAFLTALAFLFEVSPTAGLVLGGAGAAAFAWHSFRALRSVFAR